MSVVKVLCLMLGCNAIAAAINYKRPQLASEYTVSVPVVGNPTDMYTVSLQLGKQFFDVMLDSGSSNLILPGIDCIGCESVPTVYAPGAMSKDLHIYDFMEYGTNSYATGAYGDFYLDGVTMSRVGPVSLVVMSVTACGLQGPKSTIRTGAPMEGILGIGPEGSGFLNLHGIGRLGNDSYLNALAKFDIPGVLAVQLCDYNGHLWLGGYNSRYTQDKAEPEYAPTEQLSYRIGMGDMLLGNQSIIGVTNASTLVDTGTNLLVLPNEYVFVQFMSIIDPGVNVFDIAGCTLKSFQSSSDIDEHFPSMTISFIKNFTDYAIGKEFNIRASQSYMVPSRQNNGSTSWCHRVMYGGGEVILGAPLMRHFVVIFDVDENRVGFIPQLTSKCPKVPAPPAPLPPTPAPPPPPPPFPWWKILLICTSCVIALSLAVFVLERYGNGPTAWYSAIFPIKSGFRERGNLEEALNAPS